MASFITPFINDNPWWANPEAIEADGTITRFEASPVRFEHAIPFDIELDATYTLRGPRQVGKSTLLKRIIRQLLVERRVPPSCVLYSDVEGAGFTTPTKLGNALTAYATWARGRASAPAQRLYLFLDEVTGIKDWGNVVRTLHAHGVLTNVCVLATGSHALDLARGGELAPGRRGEIAAENNDWVLMPLGFRDYVTAHDPQLGAVLPVIDILNPAEAYRTAMELQLRGGEIKGLFERYLLTGGYPHPMAEEAATRRVPAGAYNIYRDAIIGQMRRAGYRIPSFREIVSWAADGRLGQEFSWNDVSGDTDVGSKETARRYVEDAERLYLWHVLYRAQSMTNTSAALRSPKKLYPADPFAWHVLASWVQGHANPWEQAQQRLLNTTMRGAFVESVAADHMLRAYGGSLVRYHRSDAGTGNTEEIDLVVWQEQQRALLEIKYRNVIKTAHRRHLARHGGGLLVTPESVEWHATDNVAEVPLHLLLAGLPNKVTLYPAHPA